MMVAVNRSVVFACVNDNNAYYCLYTIIIVYNSCSCPTDVMECVVTDRVETACNCQCESLMP